VRGPRPSTPAAECEIWYGIASDFRPVFTLGEKPLGEKPLGENQLGENQLGEKP
jgi:hypothetical protein